MNGGSLRLRARTRFDYASAMQGNVSLRAACAMLLVAFTGACGGAAVAPTTTNAEAPMTHQDDAGDKQVADAMLAKFTDAWNREDPVAYGDGYWPDAELVDPSGAIHQGREAIVKTHVELWSGWFKGSHNGGTVRKIRRVGPDFLVVDLDLALRDYQQLPPGAVADSTGALNVHLKHIMEKRNGQWKIIAGQNTFAIPRPPH